MTSNDRVVGGIGPAVDGPVDIDASPIRHDAMPRFGETAEDLRPHEIRHPPGPLDDLARWGPMTSPAGVFHLEPVRPTHDLGRISQWMNDPVVSAFWELHGPSQNTVRHLRAQWDGPGHSVPCLGVLNGRPMSYWEVYRADLDALARHYPARPHDIGIHLLIGDPADRGRGLGGVLLAAVSGHIFVHHPLCGRIVAEPDVRNTRSVSAFHRAGFTFLARIRMPGKSAALMLLERPSGDRMGPGRHQDAQAHGELGTMSVPARRLGDL